MCSEKRATFQKTSLDNEGHVENCFSITLSRVQAWTSIMVAMTVLIGAVVGAIVWIKVSVADVAHEVFEQKLESYHSVMRPQHDQRMNTAIDQKIAEHKIAAEAPFEKRLDQIETRLTTLESSTASEMSATRRDIARLEGKIDKLLER